MKKKKKAKSKWIKLRHRIVTSILYFTLGTYTVLKYRIKIKKLSKDQKRQLLVLYNHQTPFDQFFVGMALRTPVYYLATEDIFSNGFVSSLIRFLVAPIPIRKQTADIKAVMNCIRVAHEGGTIAIAPEGNRTYSGKTEYINPSIATLASKLNLPIAIFRIEGGYGVQPRWSDVVRKGKMRGYISRIIEPEEYKSMDKDQLNRIICDELYVNEAKCDGEYVHKRRAEYLERAIYVCPKCGLSVLESSKDTVRCTKCGLEARYLTTKEIEGTDGDFPFRFVNDWYEYQNEFVSKLDLSKYINEPMYTDKADIRKVIVYKKKEPFLKNANLSLYGDRIIFNEGDANEKILTFDKISSASVLGRNKLNIYFEDDIYQIKGGKRFCALKYVNIYYHSKKSLCGGENVKFLGL